MVATPQLSSRKVSKKQSVKKAENAIPKKKLSVICFRKLPHVFSEKEVRSFFGQFGKIVKLRLSRSPKTGGSRGYGYIQYDMPEIAHIAAEAANNYFIGGKPISVDVMSPESVDKRLFIGAHPGNHAISRANKVRKQHNAFTHSLSDEGKIKKDAARSAKLAALGVDYEFTRRVVQKKEKKVEA
jgi:nucleolar protein 15